MRVLALTQSLGRLLAQWLYADLDLLALWIALWVAQCWVPPGSPLAQADFAPSVPDTWDVGFLGSLLARADFAPWMALVLTFVALLRGRVLGDGAHPSLACRSDRVGWLCKRFAVATTPALVLAWFEAIPSGSLGPAVIFSLAQLALLSLGQRDGNSAWKPEATPELQYWLTLSVLTGLVCTALHGFTTIFADPAFPVAAQVGMTFVMTGAFAGSPRHRAQRRHAGRADKSAWRPRPFIHVLAALGPGLGWLILHSALGSIRATGHSSAGIGVSFDLAYIMTLYGIAWGRVLWSRPRPIARIVLLHEVMPAGGWDGQDPALAQAFVDTPLGSLRFSPLRVRRTRVVHTWVVPVLAPRVATADDPVRLLWPPPPAPAPQHALGEARFDPDPLLNVTQMEAITIHLAGGMSDQVNLREDALARRILVLRPFPGGLLGGSKERLYQWESALPTNSVQVLDGSTRTAQICDGDVILLASGGRSRAYEVEFAQPIIDRFLLDMGRPPQLEDYVRVSA